MAPTIFNDTQPHSVKNIIIKLDWNINCNPSDLQTI